MSEANQNKPSPEGGAGAPKKKLKLLIIVVLVVVLIGGGGGFYYWRASSVSAAEASDSKGGKNGEKKSRAKAEAENSGDEAASDDEEKPAKKSGKSAAATSLKEALPNDEEVKHIIEMQPFIVNLADSEQARYLRLTVNLGVGGEAAESTKPDQLFLNRIRNAMLAVLTTKNSADVLSIEGKSKLRKELLKAAQAASEEPKVEAIYITDFIVQL